MGMILRIASSRIVGQGDIVGRSGYFSLNLSANSVMRGRLDARRTLKSLVADLRQNIINRYEKKDSPYVFPILNTEDGNKAYSQYEIALNYYNRQLKRLSNFLEPNINLSSYTPRHTWATTARNKNVPLSIISAGMGHSSERTTLIYLTKIENSVIDEVNKTIIDSIKQ